MLFVWCKILCFLSSNILCFCKRKEYRQVRWNVNKFIVVHWHFWCLFLFYYNSKICYNINNDVEGSISTWSFLNAMNIFFSMVTFIQKKQIFLSNVYTFYFEVSYFWQTMFCSQVIASKDKCTFPHILQHQGACHTIPGWTFYYSPSEKIWM